MIAWLLTAETGKHAGPDGLTGQLNCTGAGLCDTAAEFRARQSQDIAPAYPAAHRPTAAGRLYSVPLSVSCALSSLGGGKYSQRRLARGHKLRLRGALDAQA